MAVAQQRRRAAEAHDVNALQEHHCTNARGRDQWMRATLVCWHNRRRATWRTRGGSKPSVLWTFRRRCRWICMRSASVSNDVASVSALLVERAKRRGRQARHHSSLCMTKSFKLGGLMSTASFTCVGSNRLSNSRRLTDVTALNAQAANEASLFADQVDTFVDDPMHTYLRNQLRATRRCLGGSHPSALVLWL